LHSEDIIKKSKELIEKMDAAMIEDKKRAACIRHANEGHKMSQRCRQLMNASTSNVNQTVNYFEAVADSYKPTINPMEMSSMATSVFSAGMQKYDEHKTFYIPPWTQEGKQPFNPDQGVKLENGNVIKLGDIQRVFNNNAFKRVSIRTSNGIKRGIEFCPAPIMLDNLNQNARFIFGNDLLVRFNDRHYASRDLLDIFKNYQIPGIRVPDESSPDLEISGRINGWRDARRIAPLPEKVPKSRVNMEKAIKKEFGIPYVDFQKLSDPETARDFYTSVVQNIRIAPAVVHTISYIGPMGPAQEMRGSTAYSTMFEGLAYNASVLGNRYLYEQKQKENFETGWHVQPTIISVFNHEMAHKIDEMYDITSIPRVREMYDNMSAMDISNGLSTYALTNTFEFVAECWAEYLGTSEPRPISQEVGDIIIARIKQYEAAANRNI